MKIRNLFLSLLLTTPAPAQWNQLTALNNPSPRSFGASAYDPNSDTWIIYGGLDNFSPNARFIGGSNIFDFDTNSWSSVRNDAVYTTGSVSQTVVHGQQIIFFKKSQGGIPVNRFFMTHGRGLLDGANQTPRSMDFGFTLAPGSAPSTHWTNVTYLGNIPLAREDYSMVYADLLLDNTSFDANCGIVLIGGRGVNPVIPWTWNSSEAWDIFIGDMNSIGNFVVWRRIPSLNHPPALINAVFVWVPDGHFVSGGYFVYSGGFLPSNQISHEVWTWDGVIDTNGNANWTRHADTSFNLNGAVGVYDAKLGRAVAIGGEFGSAPYEDRTLAFNGVTNIWEDITPLSNFPRRSEQYTIYRNLTQQIYMFGGNGDGIGSSNKKYNDTWMFDTLKGGSLVFGNSCTQAGGNTMLSLTDDIGFGFPPVFNEPIIGNDYTLRTIVSQGHIFNGYKLSLLLGVYNPNTPFFGCTLLSSADMALSITVINDMADFKFNISNNTALIGAAVYWQSFGLEPSTNYSMLSNGLKTVIGR